MLFFAKNRWPVRWFGHMPVFSLSWTTLSELVSFRWIANEKFRILKILASLHDNRASIFKLAIFDRNHSNDLSDRFLIVGAAHYS